MRPSLRRALAALAATTLVFAACGDDSDTTAATSTTMADGHDDGHSHGGVDVGQWDAVPTLAITADADAVSGVNVQLETTEFTFAPEHASEESVEGEGHAHIYVDGEKLNRVYGDWYHLAGLEPGEHEIRVELSANDHSTLELDGEAIDDTVTVTVPEPGDHMDHGEGREAASPAPTVSLEIVDDAKSGYNVHVETTDFAFAPENASGDAADGEGHAHLYVDGQKVARLYTPWFHLDALDPGEHEIRVELNGNDHVVLLSGGSPIEATETLFVEGSEPAAASDGTVIEIDVVAGEVNGGGRQKAALGESVTIRVTSDVDDHIHLHGYDVLTDVRAGTPAELTFDATIPGVFEVELEDSGVLLVELEIS